MLKTLLKKQFLELNRGFFYDSKKQQRRSKVTSILFIALYALLMVGLLGGMFTILSVFICLPLVSAGQGWLYFLILTLISIFLGVFGSVFNTYAGLYQSKDNDLLLSLPIPVRNILIVRLLGVYLMGLMFSAVVLLPGILVYLILTPFSFAALFGCIWLLFLVSLLVLTLSCILGWVVAKIAAKLKNKSFITVIVSVAFLGIYYFVYFKAQSVIEELISNVEAWSASVKGAAYPLYLLGSVGVGDPLAIAVVGAVILGAAVATYLILAKSFLGIATAGGTSGGKVYRETTAKVRKPFFALLSKEFRRFTGSATYMLNTGMGVLFLTVAGVFLLIRGSWMRELMQQVFPGNTEFAAMLFSGGICMIASMNYMSAPSVSLEGKSIWIVQSLPVPASTVLSAKLSMHLILTAIPAFFCSVATIIALRPGLLGGAFLILIPLLFSFLTAAFGVFLNLKRPNLNWTSEIYPIKQGMNVMISMLSGWAYSALLIAGVLLIPGGKMIAILILSAFAALTLLLDVVLSCWLKKRGAGILSYL